MGMKGAGCPLRRRLSGKQEEAVWNILFWQKDVTAERRELSASQDAAHR